LSIHLDTSVVIGVLNDKDDYSNRYAEIRAARESVFVSSIVVFELRFGLALSRLYEANANAVRQFLGTLTAVLPFTDEEATVAGEIRASLQKIGKPIGPYDLLIAAQAVRVGATLVTANVAEFRRVPGLMWKNWAK
jgi:tRNA(fMet)-specific endonuclease VapC